MGLFGGLFESSYETHVGFQYVDLGQSSVDSYYKFRRGLLFASNGNVDFYQEQMFKFKQNYRHKYSHKRLNSLGFGPETKTIPKNTYNDFISTSNIPSNTKAINTNTIYSPLQHSKSYYYSTFSDEDMAVIYAINNIPGTYTTLYKRDNNVNFSNVPNYTNDGNHTYLRYEVSGGHSILRDSKNFIYEVSLYGVKKYEVTSYTYILYSALLVSGATYSSTNQQDVVNWIQANKAPNESAAVNETYITAYNPETITTIGNVTYTIPDEEIYYHVRALSDSGSNFNIKILDMFNTRGYLHDVSQPTVTLQFAPLIPLKENNSSVLEEKRKKALKEFSLDEKSIKPYINNGNIDDFYLTLSIAPEDALRSRELSKLLWNTLDSLAPSTTDFLGAEDRYTIDMSINTLSASTSFSLSQNIKTGVLSSIYPNIKKWRVVIKQNITNQQKYYNEVLSVYNSLGFSGQTTTADMYDRIFNDKIYVDENNGTYAKDSHPLRGQLPSRDARNNRKPKRYYYIYCTESEIPSKVDSYLRYKGNIISSILSYNEINANIELSKYYSTSSTVETLTYDSNGYPILTASPNVSVTVMKQITPTTYKSYTIYNGTTTYNPVSSIPATKAWDSLNGSFRIPVKFDALEGKPYFETIELYDHLSCGVIFTEVVVEIKWYQKGWFKVFIQIVAVIIAVVITYFSAGAGAGIGGAIIATAETAAIVYAVSVVVEQILIAFDIDPKYAKLISTIIIAAYTGYVDTNTIFKIANEALEIYMESETEKIQDDAKRLKEESDNFYRKYNDLRKDLEASINGTPQSRTKDEIIANIINRDLLYTSDGDRIFNDSSSLHIEPDSIDEYDDKSWMVPPVPKFSLYPTNTLPEKGQIKDIRIELPKINISLGIIDNTFI
jgi:hypothetical protein